MRSRECSSSGKLHLAVCCFSVGKSCGSCKIEEPDEEITEDRGNKGHQMVSNTFCEYYSGLGKDAILSLYLSYKQYVQREITRREEVDTMLYDWDR